MELLPASSRWMIQPSTSLERPVKNWCHGGYGAVTQTAGTTTINNFIALGGSTLGGVINLSGGTLTKSGYPITIGWNGGSGWGVMNLSGDAVYTGYTGGFDGVWLGENGTTTGILNMSGTSQLNIRSNGNLADGGGLVFGRAIGTSTGIANLNGGTTYHAFCHKDKPPAPALPFSISTVVR